MSDWLDETGDGLYAIGDLLKSEMIDNLQTVKTLMSDISRTSLWSSSPLTVASVTPQIDSKALANSRATNNSVSFGSLLTVQGNVTEDVMPKLQDMISKSEKSITNSIMEALTFK